MDKKATLLQTIAPVRRGLNITETQLQAINSAVAYLEEQNPNPKPTEVPEILSGNWRMLFTTSKSLLGFDRLPLTSLGEIYQYVDAAAGKIYNVAELISLPLLGSVASVVANFSVASSVRVDVQFTRSVLGLRSVLNYGNVNSFIEKLSTGKRLFALDIPIKPRAGAWLDITYLDRDLRIGRGNGGNLFVLTKVK